MNLLKSFTLLIAIAVAGCQFNSQAVRIAPVLNPQISDIGQGRLLSIRVLDGRDSNIIGNRGVGGNIGGTISTLDGIDAQVLSTLQNAFRAKGFKIQESRRTDVPHLSVEVRGLKYGWQSGFFSNTLKVECIVKASATNSTKDFDRVFRSEKADDTNWTPTAEYNEKLVNDILSETLAKVVNDGDLLNFLARKM
jgi:uncharacterized lipoprotein